MNPINRALSLVGMRLSWLQAPPPSALRPELDLFYKQLSEVQSLRPDLNVFEEFRYDVAEAHPEDHRDYECAFATEQIRKLNPQTILDVGSYRYWILGLLAAFKVTTVDVRDRHPLTKNETVVTSDAKQLAIPNDSFDVVTSLCALEHFGLGRYGDEFDLDADVAAFNEMRRVTKPGGHLIFTTGISRLECAIAFNAHRIYTIEAIHRLCEGMKPIRETVFSLPLARWCETEEATTEPRGWDVYMGCWQK